MQGLAFPVAPLIGQVVKGFAWDGKAWNKAKPRLVAQWTNVQVFRTSGRYEPSDDLLYAIIECVGAGGGGGWATRNTAALTGMAAASGGGSGGYSRSTLPAEAIVQGADVVIAPGLIVGFSQTGWQYALDTSFGGLVIAKGGQNAMPYDGQGVTGVVPSFGQPGLGAPVGTGDLAMPGAGGAFWTTCTSWSGSSPPETFYLAGGMGGAIMGGNTYPTVAWSPNSNVNGSNAVPNSGAGGAGGIVANTATALGGSGGSGLCVVTEFCGTEDGGGGPGPEPPGPGRPPGVPINLDIKARVTHVPWDCGPHVEPVK